MERCAACGFEYRLDEAERARIEVVESATVLADSKRCLPRQHYSMRHLISERPR